MRLYKLFILGIIALMALELAHPEPDQDTWTVVRVRERRKSLSYQPPQGRRTDECPNLRWVRVHHKLNVNNLAMPFTREEANEACQFAYDGRLHEPHQPPVQSIMMGESLFVEAKPSTCINVTPRPFYECRFDGQVVTVKAIAPYCFIEHTKVEGHILLTTLRCTYSLTEPVTWYSYQEVINILDREP